MKALSVTQPWASVICSGMKDVENRKWQAAQAPGRILIHATATKVPGNWEDCPDDMVSAVKNARLMGRIPEYREMPYGSIIGYVTCDRIVRDSDSFWAQEGSFHWCLKDAYLFDEPIPDVKGVRGHLFDFDIDENNLPASHKIEDLHPAFDADTLVMPVGKEVVSRLRNGENEFVYELDPLFDSILGDEKTGGLRQPKKLKFVGKDEAIEKEVALLEVGNYLDEKGKPIMYKGFDGAEIPWSYVYIQVK